MTDVSTVIPTYRRGKLLLEAIDSVLAQQDVSVEIIVVDDDPDGSAREEVETIGDPRVRYLRSDVPSGGRPALVRNQGWKHASGRFVHFLDDDDLVAAGYYRAAVRTFEANPGRGVVFGRIEPFSDPQSGELAHERRFFEAAARRTRFWSRLDSRWLITANLLFMPTLLVNSACMVRREHVHALGGYDPHIALNEDVDFFCRAIRRFGHVYLDRVVVHYRVLADSLMNGREDDRRLAESYQRMYAQYRETHGPLELLAMKVVARTVLRIP